MPTSKIPRKAMRKKQTRLRFDPIGTESTSPPYPSTYSPAKVRYQPSKLIINTSPASFVSSSTHSSARKPVRRGGEDTTLSLNTLRKPNELGKVKVEDVSEDKRDGHFDPCQSNLNHKPFRVEISPMRREVSEHDLTKLSHKKGKSGICREPVADGSSTYRNPSTSSPLGHTAHSTPKTTPSRTHNPLQSDVGEDALVSSRLRSSRPFTESAEKIYGGVRRPLEYIFSDSEDSDVTEDEITLPTRKKKPEKMSKPYINTSSSPLPNLKRNLPITISISDEEDSDPISSPLKRRRATALIDEDRGFDASPPKRSRRSSGNGDGLGNTRSARKRAPRSTAQEPVTPTRMTRQQRNPAKRHRTEREKHMELLRRKRAGEKVEALTESESGSEDEDGALYDSNSELEALSTFEDDDQDGVDVPEVTPTRKEGKGKAKETHKRKGSYADDSDMCDFVVEDSDDPLGIPDLSLHSIPLQYTHAARKSLRDHFKDAVEWMVHNKLNPAFDRNADIYRYAFIRLDAECSVNAHSKFVSTAWTADFTRALKARPQYVERRLEPGEGQDKCEACNHRRHVPTYGISFRGKAYHRETLVEVDQDSDEDTSEEEEIGDDKSVNSKGDEIEGEDKEWLSGQFCRRNARQAHALLHWRYNMNEWVLDQLEQEGELAVDRLQAREKMKSKQRHNYANDLTDTWWGTGIVKKGWRDFKAQLEMARREADNKDLRWGRVSIPRAEAVGGRREEE